MLSPSGCQMVSAAFDPIPTTLRMVGIAFVAAAAAAATQPSLLAASFAVVVVAAVGATKALVDSNAVVASGWQAYYYDRVGYLIVITGLAANRWAVVTVATKVSDRHQLV